LSAIDIPLHRIERVEIMRGNASALYGNAANGGVIHIFTRQEAGASAQLGVGSYGARTADAAFSTKVGETVVSLGEVVQISVGFAADVGEWYGAGEITAFVIDGDREGARHAPQPSKVLAVAGYDEFKPRTHDWRRRRIGRRW
jgi:outer membrane cobalamin receptor